MTTEVSTAAAGALASLQSLKAGLTNVRSSVRVASGDPFLRLLTDGTWVYGSDDTEVQEGSLWAIHPASLQHGFVKWTDYDEDEKRSNEIVDERMVPMTAALPNVEELPKTEWKWAQQLSLVVVCVSGEDKGTQVLFKTTSVGGKKAVNELLDAILAQLDTDPAHPVPVVNLEVGSYKHRKYGKTYYPILTIKKWVALDAKTLEGSKPADAADPQPAQVAPAQSRRRPAAAPEAAATAPAQAETEQDVFDEAVVAQHAPVAGTAGRRRRNA